MVKYTYTNEEALSEEFACFAEQTLMGGLPLPAFCQRPMNQTSVSSSSKSIKKTKSELCKKRSSGNSSNKDSETLTEISQDLLMSNEESSEIKSQDSLAHETTITHSPHGIDSEKYYKKFDFFYRRTAFRSMTEYYKGLFKPVLDKWREGERKSTKNFVQLFICKNAETMGFKQMKVADLKRGGSCENDFSKF